MIYARSPKGLLATRFDESRLAVSGTAVPVVDGVITNLSGGAHFDLSPSGTLAYVPGINGESDRELAWVTLDGDRDARRRHARDGPHLVALARRDPRSLEQHHRHQP